MSILQEQYVVDTKGKKTAVLLSLKQYEQLMEDLHLPPINIPNLPPDINQQNIQMLIQQVVSSVVQQSLNNAVQIAVDQLVKSLPHAGFERFSFDSGWKKEE